MNRVQRRRRTGTLSIEVTMFLCSVFVIAMLTYWVGQAGFVGLFEILGSHIGAPYL